ncbi:hypothetical protein MFFC18_35180 [Mariniblastus fucicola]|uniref:Uncharacterized protein n=1 Tax=Mariniblastus fucicola TaxID=980251 RepID=A0A5B9PA21_9BACT|nr:hypothetical protein MFFC18_35180 [Mariniblastus fucicola]
MKRTLRRRMYETWQSKRIQKFENLILTEQRNFLEPVSRGESDLTCAHQIPISDECHLSKSVIRSAYSAGLAKLTATISLSFRT